MRSLHWIAAVVIGASVNVAAEQLPPRLGRDQVRVAIDRAPVDRVGPREFTIDLSTLKPGAVSVQTTPDNSRVVDASAGRLSVKPWEYVVTGRAPGAAPTVASAEAAPLDANVAAVTASGELVQFEPVFSAANGLALGEGLRYSGVLLLGLRQVSGPPVPARLESPLAIDVAGPVDDISPRRVVVDRVNTLEAVTLTARSPSDPVVLDIIVGGSPSASRVSLAVRHPLVSIHASPASIDGLGLGETTLTVRVDGLPPGTSLPVTVTAGSGYVRTGNGTSTTVNVVDGVASMRLRSGVFGIDTIQAMTSVGSDDVTVTYDVPFAFLAAALLGGLLGARLGRRGIGTGALAALLAAAAYAIGVSFVPQVPAGIAGTAATFVVAGLAGLGGAKLFAPPATT